MFRRIAPILLVLPAMAACRGNRPPPNSGGDDGTAVGDVPKVDRALQIALVSPNTLAPNAAAQLTIQGTGFEQGATAQIEGQGVLQTKFVDANTLTAQTAGLFAGSYDLTVTNPSGDKVTLQGALSVREGGGDVTAECRNVTVYFGVDKSNLEAQAKTELQGKLACWTSSQRPFTVDGHADERGTTDYNLALGQRRADAVSAWLTAAGVAPGRVRSVSYGEEKPADAGHTEAAWAKNRRAEVHY